MKYLYFLFFISITLAGPIQDASEKYILEQFQMDAKIEIHTLKLEKKIKSKIQVLSKQKFYRDKLYYWKISENDSTIAYAFIDNVIGKSMPITFMVILGINGNIIKTTIIKYREAYGSEIKNLGWLAQFNNRNNQSSYIVDKDIDGISGATISVNSISKGINKIAILYPLIKNQLNE